MTSAPELKPREATKLARQEKYASLADARRHSAMHIAAFVLGLLAILGHFFWYISLVCGVLAIVFGARSASRTGSKLGKAGLVLGIVALALTVFIYSTIISISFLAWL